MLARAWRLFRMFQQDRRAVTAIEYALIGSLIFLVIVAGLTSLGTALRVPLGTVGTALH